MVLFGSRGMLVASFFPGFFCFKRKLAMTLHYFEVQGINVLIVIIIVINQ